MLKNEANESWHSAQVGCGYSINSNAKHSMKIAWRQTRSIVRNKGNCSDIAAVTSKESQGRGSSLELGLNMKRLRSGID